MDIHGINSYLSSVEHMYREKFNGAENDHLHGIAIEVSRRFVSLGPSEQVMARGLVDDYEVAAYKASERFGGRHIFPGDVPGYLSVERELEKSRASNADLRWQNHLLWVMDKIWYGCTPGARSELSRIQQMKLHPADRALDAIERWLMPAD